MIVKELGEHHLNYWVAKSAGLKLSARSIDPEKPFDRQSGGWHPRTYDPANDWSKAVVILVNEWSSIEPVMVEWFGFQWQHMPTVIENPLKWFMRAYVAANQGEDVEDVTDFGLDEPGQAVQMRLNVNSGHDAEGPERQLVSTALDFPKAASREHPLSAHC
jgi:hypothetical protein